MFILIGRPDFAGYPTITENLDDSIKLDPYIAEAQRLDLKPLLGDALFFDLLANMEDSPQLAKYVDLVYGKDYTDPDEIAIQYPGLVPVLCYFTYARVQENMNKNITTLGMGKRKSEYLEPFSGKEIAAAAQQARSAAISYWHEAKKFLDDHFTLDKALYPLWNVKCTKRGSPTPQSIRVAGSERGKYPYWK